MRTIPINNGIKKYLKSREIHSFKFTPSTEFYKTNQIGQKRWGQIIRNEKPVTIAELQRLSTYFGTNINSFLS